MKRTYTNASPSVRYEDASVERNGVDPLSWTPRGALKAYGVVVLESRTGHRVADPAALGAGVPVLGPGGTTTGDVRALADEVLDLLNTSDEQKGGAARSNVPIDL